MINASIELIHEALYIMHCIHRRHNKSAERICRMGKRLVASHGCVVLNLRLSSSS